MKVILRKDVQSVGEAGDIVNVADGYARNFLLPTKVAEAATPGAIKNRETNLGRIKAKAEKLHQESVEKAKKIEELGKIEVTAKAGETGKLFGTITTKKLAELVQEKIGFEIDRKGMSLDRPINQLGEYRLLIKLSSKVSQDITIEVKASEIIKEKYTEEVAEEA